MRREEDSPHRAAVRAALVAMPGADAVGVLHARLRDPKTPGEWRLLFIEVLEDRGGDGLVPRLMELFTDRDPDVALAALDAVGRLGFPAEADMLLRQLLSSDSQALRASAVASLGLVAVLDPSWEKKLLGISKESDSALRMGAARALAHLHTVPALERLHEMLGDTDGAVRAEAVRQVGNLRRLPSVPLLIERLAVETGRMREDVAACLRLMTGLDHGRAAPRWERWWKAEGEGYELPTLEEAMRADEDRRRNDPGDEQRSVSSFYGLQVISDRVCFILDTSGSMSSAANWGGGRSQSDGKGPTRLDVAQQELGKALAAYPEGDYFNVVFFEGTAQPWEDQLQKMTEKVRAKVQKFVAKQNPAGGTALYDALQIAFDDPLVDTIYLLTDGAPSAGKVTDPALIRAEVSRWNRVRHVRIHCIAIGMDTELMRGLAADSGGEYRALR